MARYEYLQHMISGDVYAVEMDKGEQVVRSVGPLAWREMPADPGECAVNMSDEDNDDFNIGNDWLLLSQPEINQRRAYAQDEDA